MPVFYPSSSSSSSSSLPNVYNFLPASTLTRWRAAQARVKSSQGNARILCVGDSTTYGVGTGATLTTGNQKPFSYPTQLANLLTMRGVNAHWNSFSGGGANSLTAPNNSVNDARIVMGSSWSFYNGSIPTIGGCYWTPSSTTNALSFTPTVNVDTFTVFYHAASGDGSFSLDINGSGTTTINAGSGSVRVTSTSITGTLGSNTLNIKQVSGNVYIVAVSAYDSSKKWVDVMNAGWQGSHAGDLVGGGGFALAMTGIAPDLTLINIGINDWVGSTSVSAYTTSVQSLITATKTVGDVILITPNPSNTSSASTAAQQALITALYGLAASNNVTLIDLWARWQSYAVSNPLGLTYDSLHPNPVGYNDVVQAIGNVLCSA